MTNLFHVDCDKVSEFINSIDAGFKQKEVEMNNKYDFDFRTEQPSQALNMKY